MDWQEGKLDTSFIRRMVVGDISLTLLLAIIVYLTLGLLYVSSRTHEGPFYRWLMFGPPFPMRPILNIFLITMVVAAIFFMVRIYGRILELVRASSKIYTDEEETIRLSKGMRDIEYIMNQAKMDLYRRERAAKDAERKKNDLITYLAHDLKTPITSIVGYLSLLRDEPDLSPETRARYIGITLDKAERLECLIDEFFDIARFNVTTQILQKQRLNLSMMIEQIAYEFRPMLHSKKLTLKAQIENDMTILVDVDKIERVVDNLLRNAISYCYPDTEIELSLYSKDQEAVIEIKNEGPTIPQDKLDRIFEQFFRLDSARNTKTGGAGLGLAIAKELVEIHGGKIEVESAQEQVTFRVSLPYLVRKS